jgi:hypothetical protein
MRRIHWGNKNGRGWQRLALCALAIAAVWLGVLPLLGRQQRIRAYVERNEALGIDPTAKFYTELPAMPEIFDRMESAQRRAEKSRNLGLTPSG